MNNKEIKLAAIIPARGGSKGIPRKNLHVLGGKPLIGWTIEAAKNSRYVSQVFVSTDDHEIASVARVFGAEVVMRPPELSGDMSSSEDALLHTLFFLREAGKALPESFVFLQCTSPLTRAEDIDGTIEALLRENADSALSVSRFHSFLWREDVQEGATGVNHDKFFRPLRQQRDAEYLETGAVYAIRTELFLKHKHRFFGKTVIYKMPEERCCEIDSPTDLLIAEAMLREQLNRDKLSQLPVPVTAVVLDFDGVLTDNRVLVLEDGREAVFCSRSDGWGIEMLKKTGVLVAVMSTEKNPVVAARCEKLGIECLQGLGDKAGALRSWASKHQVNLVNTVFVGNDENDLECLKEVGCPVVVADAHPKVSSFAKILLDAKGGAAAVRELFELIKKI